MPRSHWLDPLARRVLQATGQLPPPSLPTQSLPIEAKPPAWVMDVNRASRDQWLQLPGCSQDTADLLVRLQHGGVQFASADDLFQLLELPSDLVRLWSPHLLFQWHGDAPPQPQAIPLDLNNASADQLHLSIETTKHCVTGLLRKLDAKSRTQAVLIAFQRNLVDPPLPIPRWTPSA